MLLGARCLATDFQALLIHSGSLNLLRPQRLWPMLPPVRKRGVYSVRGRLIRSIGYPGLCGVALIVSVDCGGFDTDRLARLGPAFDPLLWFAGDQRGLMHVLDRNGNLRASAEIVRDCENPDGQQGRCTDSYRHFSYAPDGAVREGTLQVHVDWLYELTPGEVGVLSIEDGTGKMTGEVRGCAAALSGERSLPLDPESRRATAEVLIQNLPGPPGHVLQTEVFTRLGVRLGSVETHWYPR